MSSGSYTTSNYRSDIDKLYLCVCQPEVMSAVLKGNQNQKAVGEPLEPGKLRLHKNKREPGLHARFVTVRFTGTPPAGYSASSRHKIVVFRYNLFNLVKIGDVGQYLGRPIKIIGKSPEFYV